MKRGLSAVLVLVVLAAGCAGAMGSRDPITRDAVALRVAPGTTAQAAGDFIRQGSFEYALLATQQDSAWIAAAATQAGLQATNPARFGNTTYAFFGPAAVGDTTHTVPVPGGGRILMHDALFRESDRLIDLMLVRFDSINNVHSAVSALLGYIGSDVGNTAVLLLAIETPSQQFGDSVANELRAAYTDTRECANQPPDARLRLFYGPEARARCESAQIRSEGGGAISARFVLP
jgi:hypothetical protein